MAIFLMETNAGRDVVFYQDEFADGTLMKKSSRFRLSTLLLHIALIAALGSAAALHLMYSRFHPASYTPAPQREGSAILDNPYRGFYHMYGFQLSEEPPENMAARCRQYLRADTGQLMMVEINLKNYSGADLSENALMQLDGILSEISSAGKQLVLRFLYDWDGAAADTEPKDIAGILGHMGQVCPVINRYADAVFVLQGIFTGNHGEMHGTSYGSLEDSRRLMAHLAQLVSPSIFLAVRTPSQLRGITDSADPLPPENAFDGTLPARLGLFNDGMLGSDSDLGTYGAVPFAESASPSAKGTRKEEIAFQDSLCQYVPNGGEAVIDNPCNDLENAVADMGRMHITYLNRDYDAAVMDKWKASAYEGDGCFRGMNGLDYIEAHLGYRYVVTSSSLTHDAMGDSDAVLSLAIRNTGFAPAYRCFDGTVTLRHTASDVLISVPAPLDTRTIKAGSETTFAISLPVRFLPEGSYEISFGLEDPSTKKPILFANEGAGQDGVLLGTLTIEPTENGAAWDAFLKALFQKP